MRKRKTFISKGIGKGLCCIAWVALLLLPGISSLHANPTQNKTVTGVVTSETDNEPLVGVSVQVLGASTGSITNFDGRYSVDVSQGQTLLFSYIGFKNKEIKVGASSVINVMMQEDVDMLDEVVVIGYQTVKRRDLTGSVASVSADDLIASPVTNVAQALQGKLPGVNVTTQDGRPGGSISIRVRGGGSITQSNEPLILIDGVSGSLEDIPSDQIESIDVLKDASSTAIYGARGANGVILVTTKGAKEGRVTVNYNGFVKLNTTTGYYDVLHPYDYLSYIWAMGESVGGNSYTQAIEKTYGIGRYEQNGGINAYKDVPFYDVQKEIYNGSFSHNHDLSIGGGNDKTKVLFGLNYMDENGMRENSYWRRANVSLKVNQKINKKMTFGLDTRYTHVNSKNNSPSGGGVTFRPIATANIRGDMDGLREGALENYGKGSQWDRYDPIKEIYDKDSPTYRQALRATGSFNWEIIKGLTYRTELSLAKIWTQKYTWEGAIAKKYINDATDEIMYAGDASVEKIDKWNLRWTNTLNYDFVLAKKHHFNVLAGYEVADSDGNSLKVGGTYYPANFTKKNAWAMLNQVDVTQGKNTITSSVDTPNRIVSYFGRLNYTLNERYLFTATFRTDGSSKFSPDHRWGFFPAAAFGWRMSEEPFMKDIKWLDNLKLRLSYGEVGNDAIDASLWSMYWKAESDIGNMAIFDQTYFPSYSMSGSLANLDLKWETTITRNAGFDFGLFNNRLRGTVDVYWNTTKDLLTTTPIPGITGFTSTYANIGQTSNRGIEISLQGDIYKDKKWSVTGGVNVNINRGRVDELAENVSGLYGNGGSAAFPQNDYCLIIGQPVGLVRGLQADGWYTPDDFIYENGVYTLKPGIPDIDKAVFTNYHLHNGLIERPTGQNAYPGMAKFKNLNDDNVIDESDVSIIGNMNPKHTGGFNFNVKYDNFDFGAYFNWSVGNDIYNRSLMETMQGNKEGDVFKNRRSVVLDFYKIYDIKDGQLVPLVTPEQLNAANIHAKYPLAYNENYYFSDICVEDGSFLRLNTLTLGYSLPKNVINKIGVTKLRLYASCYNVFTLTGYSGSDPEVNTNVSEKSGYPKVGMDNNAYPRARSFTFGVNASF